MDEILTFYNIRTVNFLDNSHVDRKYSFSNKMLANDIFIEYYSTDSLDAEENEDAEIEDDYEIPEYGSQLSVIMKHQNKYYQFLMFHNTFEIGIPIMLLQTITFLVKMIENTKPGQLVEYLTNLSTDPLIPHEIPDREFREMAYEMLKQKIQTIQNLIKEENADLN